MLLCTVEIKCIHSTASTGKNNTINTGTYKALEKPKFASRGTLTNFALIFDLVEKVFLYHSFISEEEHQCINPDYMKQHLIYISCVKPGIW